jgi:outer membrane protein assembly factor BamB
LFHIVALNAQTGQPLWIVGPSYCRLTGEFLPTGADYHHLRLPIVGGLLLAYNGEIVVGLDAQTGRVAQSYPIQSTTWGAILDGTLYLVESVDLPQELGAFTTKRAFTLKRLNPGTGDLLSSYPLETEENTFNVDGIGNGLLYQRIYVPETGPSHERKYYRFVAYHLSDGSLAWSYTMPPSPLPTSSHHGEPRSAPVLAP